jgi:hypothetical protein
MSLCLLPGILLELGVGYWMTPEFRLPMTVPRTLCRTDVSSKYEAEGSLLMPGYPATLSDPDSEQGVWPCRVADFQRRRWCSCAKLH